MRHKKRRKRGDERSTGVSQRARTSLVRSCLSFHSPGWERCDDDCFHLRPHKKWHGTGWMNAGLSVHAQSCFRSSEFSSFHRMKTLHEPQVSSMLTRNEMKTGGWMKQRALHARAQTCGAGLSFLPELGVFLPWLLCFGAPRFLHLPLEAPPLRSSTNVQQSTTGYLHLLVLILITSPERAIFYLVCFRSNSRIGSSVFELRFGASQLGDLCGRWRVSVSWTIAAGLHFGEMLKWSDLRGLLFMNRASNNLGLLVLCVSWIGLWLREQRVFSSRCGFR